MVGSLKGLMGSALAGAGLAVLFAGTAHAASPVAPKPAVSKKVNTVAVQAAKNAHAAVQKTGKMRNRDLGSFAVPSPNSAWEKLGFKNRFFKVGDAWRMGWSIRHRRDTFKRSFTQAEWAQERWGAPVMIDYRVSKVTTQHIGGRSRQVATITAIYATGVRGRMQHGNELKVDQYLNPVERCAYTKWTPFGTCRDRDTRSVVRSMGAIPLFIGDIEHLPATVKALPTIAPTLQAVAARMVKGNSYIYVPVSSGSNNYADTYWAANHLVPSYVVSKNAQGILLGERIVR